MARAQDADAPGQLEDLIPDSAVEQPDDWASRGSEAPADSAVEAPQIPADIGEIEVGEPELPEAAANEAATPGAPLGTVDEAFAELKPTDLPPIPELEDVRIDRSLVLQFPVDRDVLPERSGFIARFRLLRQAEAVADLDESDPEGNVALQAARLRSTTALLKQQLRTYGYYNAQVVPQSVGQDNAPAAADQSSVRIMILPGKRYRFGAIDLGAIDRLPDLAEVRADFDIARGDPLLADRIVAERGELATSLAETGYPFASLAPPELLVDHDREEGDLTLAVEPGGQYVFGAVTSSRPEFLSGRHLGRIARFEQGDLYQASLVQDLRQAIQATGLVSAITVTPRETAPPQGSEPGQLALDVAIEPGRLRTIAGAIGYGSEDGVKVEASWEHRNLFPPEGALKLRAIVGTREQLLGVGFRRNNFRGRDQLLSLDAYASDIETEAVEARSIGLRGSFERYSNLLFQKPFSWQVGAEVVFSDERNRRLRGIDLPRQEYLVGSLFGRATFDRSDSLLDPTRGFRVTLFAAPEYSRTSRENAFYLRGQIDASYYRPVSDTVVLAA
ncbi:MAG: autotransporter assembly complex protein TamA, partial [Erythrobacter sp.]